jgi:Putative transposase, YhgA-like
MEPRHLTDEEYAQLKKKLHQAHDKVIKVTLHEKAAIGELMEKIVMPLLVGFKIDLASLKLDTTTYIRQNLEVFFSDVVYLATLIDKTTGISQQVKVGLLIEHKSDMPSELALRLQALDYISAIMKKNYDKKTDTTIQVVPIIFNQFDKEWQETSFRSLFPLSSPLLSRLIPEFGYLIINLSNLSDEIMDSLDKFGILKAALLAMRYVKNKEFLKLHFEEIFLFLQQHPEKTDLRDQLIAYVLGQSDLSVQDLQELLNNIFSPVLKQEIMISGNGFLAIAAREAAAKTAIAVRAEAQKEIDKVKSELEVSRSETLQVKTLAIMHGWHGGVPSNLLSAMTGLKLNKVAQLIATFEKVKAYCAANTDRNKAELKKISGLSDVELTKLLLLLEQH